MEPMPEDWERAVAVVAHPDDLEYGAAAAVARWTGQGKHVAYVLATRGEAGIEGMAPAEAVPLIEELDTHCIRPEFQYRHKWQVGDLLMWDNAAAMHIAICDYALPERRLMHRTTVIGDVPF